jgi:thymidylate synthase
MLAQVCDLSVGELVISTGDTHIYLNHLEQVREQLTRVPLLLPTLKLNSEIQDIDRFTMQDIELVGYQSYDAIRAPMAV